VNLTQEQLKKMIMEELSLVLEGDRTPSGSPSAEAREDHAVLSGGRFPIFDKKSAQSAIKLRGHNTSGAERKKIIDAAAKYAPEAAKKAREEDKENK
tara:strand:- start:625 stop:915 length:291 start_codon:yes stop_codon:yes gene_type:complete